MKPSRLVTLGALVALSLVTFAAPEVASAQQSDSSVTSAVPAVRYVALDRPLSLADATTLGASSDIEVLGYRYESAGVVGEFYNTDVQSVFLSGFRAKYGTSPEVVSLIAPGGSKYKSQTERWSRQQRIAHHAQRQPELSRAKRMLGNLFSCSAATERHD